MSSQTISIGSRGQITLPKKIRDLFKSNTIILELVDEEHVVLSPFYSALFITKEPTLTKYGVGVFSIGQTLDITAAKKELGYKPVVSMEQGINQFAQWWKEVNHAA